MASWTASRGLLLVVTVSGCANHRALGEEGGDDSGILADAAMTTVPDAAVAPCAPEPWRVETVDQWFDNEVLSWLFPQIRVLGNELQLDYALSPNDPHPRRTARRAANGTWTFEDQGQLVLGNVAKALSPDGLEVECWSERTDLTTSGATPFFCAARTPGNPWATTTLAPQVAVVKPSIVIDQQDVAHLTYTLPNKSVPIHATRDAAGAWHSENLIGGAAPYAPLALDREGCVHTAVVERMTSHPQFKLAHGVRCPTNATWAFEQVTRLDYQPVLTNASLVIDSQDRANIVFATSDEHVLRLARREDSTSTWSVEPLEAGTLVAEYSSGIAADLRGGVYIMYMKRTGTWSVEKVVLYIAAGGAVTRKSFGTATYAGSMSGVVDPTGRVHVIMDGDNKRVEYATSCPAPGVVIE